MRIYGLTGGIGSGKSTAARCFADAGIPVVDADQVSREVSRPGTEAYAEIIARFGAGIRGSDGEIDRARLRELIFADPKARKDLEAITHPRIVSLSRQRLEEACRDSGIAVYEASLLVETGRWKDFDGLIVVEAPREERIRRLLSRDGGSRASIERAIDAQASDEARRQAANWVIENVGSPDDLKRRIVAITRDWHASAAV